MASRLRTTLSTPIARRTTAHPASRAFSLVEMLTVLAVIAIIISILVPTVASARTRARKAATENLMREISNAITQFQLAERRLPGPFSQQDLGSPQNTTIGVTALDNILVELAGGETSRPTAAGSIITLSPRSGKSVNVDVTRIGTPGPGVSSKAYFKPDPKLFVKQQDPVGRRNTSDTTLPELPALIDPFGQPILAWVQNDLPADSQFAADQVSLGGNPARFYLTSNSGFINSTKLGRIGENQVTDSLLGSGQPATNRVNNLTALLGNPASPNPTTPGIPSAARGAVILHSAGANGKFVGRDERGSKKYNTGTGMSYATISAPSADPKTSDPTVNGDFDDVFITVTGG